MEEEALVYPTCHPVFLNEVVLGNLFSLLDVPSLKECRLINSTCLKLSTKYLLMKTGFDLPCYPKDWVTGGVLSTMTQSIEKTLDFLRDFKFYHPFIIMDEGFMNRFVGVGGDLMVSTLKCVTRLQLSVSHHVEEALQVILTNAAPNLQELAMFGWLPKIGSEFPILPKLQKLRIFVHDFIFMILENGYEGGLEKLHNLLKGLPNLIEFDFGLIAPTDVSKVLEEVEGFERFYTQLTKLGIRLPCDPSEIRGLGHFIHKFVNLNSLQFQYPVPCCISSPTGWHAFLDLLKGLGSSTDLTVLGFWYEFHYHQPDLSTTFQDFPCFTNLKELSIKFTCEKKEVWAWGWETLLDGMDFNRSFPQLQKLTVTMENKCGPNGAELYTTSAGYNDTEPLPQPFLCLRYLMISSNLLDKAPSVFGKDVLRRLFKRFPNAKIFLMNRFVDGTVNLE